MPSADSRYPVWRGGEPTLPDHTILRPRELRRVPYKLPLVVWANGGCRESNEEFHYFLTTFASYGIFIIANGDPQNPYEVAELAGLVQPDATKLTVAIDWALRQNADPRSSYYRRLDPRRILVMGQSCGGWEAVDASSDPRVRSTIIWNSGMNPQNPTGVADLHAPILLAEGGTFDHVAWDAIATYQLASVPAVHVTDSEAGHTNWWDDPAGTPAPSPEQRKPLPVALNWLTLTLYGSDSGKRFFLGDNCGLCQQPTWTVESKNWG